MFQFCPLQTKLNDSKKKESFMFNFTQNILKSTKHWANTDEKN